jgi:hypothetical protein
MKNHSLASMRSLKSDTSQASTLYMHGAVVDNIHRFFFQSFHATAALAPRPALGWLGLGSTNHDDLARPPSYACTISTSGEHIAKYFRVYCMCTFLFRRATRLESDGRRAQMVKRSGWRNYRISTRTFLLKTMLRQARRWFDTRCFLRSGHTAILVRNEQASLPTCFMLPFWKEKRCPCVLCFYFWGKFSVFKNCQKVRSRRIKPVGPPHAHKVVKSWGKSWFDILYSLF